MSTDTPPRKRMRAEERRDQILDVTHEIVTAESFHAATPARIAEAAGVTRAVLYQQFGDVPAIFVALIERESDRARDQFLAALADLTDGTDPFVGLFMASVQALDAHPATWRLFLAPPEGAPPALHQRLAQTEAEVNAVLEEQLELAFPGVVDARYLSRMFHAAGRELLLLRLTEPHEATPERLAALLARLVTAGHAAAGRPSVTSSPGTGTVNLYH